MDSEVFSRIRGYLAEQLEVDPEKITPDSDIVNDFGADSLDVIDMITVLSDEFGVEIPDEDIENFHTVGEHRHLDLGVVLAHIALHIAHQLVADSGLILYDGDTDHCSSVSQRSSTAAMT